jgi:HK97 family phage major capsid protein
MATETILFGDLSYYYLADREQMSVETTTQGAGTFEKHQVAIKVVERIDGKVAVNNAFKTITNAGVEDL